MILESPTSPPLSLELVKTTIGPVIAALVFFVGLLWRDRIEGRNAARLWFEQVYITEGIDLVRSHLGAKALLGGRNPSLLGTNYAYFACFD
ncbi:MAG TPA: hypothetical protein VGN86_18150 [Pyrinomonadaceae bacterium]|jgi:hypothetical protein|nr:hypothetical protein [Pyrinomonadaceae bacterium]